MSAFLSQLLSLCLLGCGDIHFKKSLFLGTRVISSLTDRRMTVQSKLWLQLTEIQHALTLRCGKKYIDGSHTYGTGWMMFWTKYCVFLYTDIFVLVSHEHWMRRIRIICHLIYLKGTKLQICVRSKMEFHTPSWVRARF